MLAPSLLTAALMLYAWGVVRLWRNAQPGQGVSVGQALCYAIGWLALVAALVSPLDALADESFAAHMAQHELIMLVAAPLIALASPLVALLWTMPPRSRRAVMRAVRGRRASAAWAAITAPATVWLLHAVTLWIWHLPPLFDAALRSESIHAVQHLTFFWSAALFWWGMAHGRYGRAGYGAAVVYVFATAVHSGVLGALLTLSPFVWFPLYATTTGAMAAYGLTPLEDQQLAGLLMWVPASVLFIAGGLYFFASWLHESGRRARFQATSSPSG